MLPPDGVDGYMTGKTKTERDWHKQAEAALKEAKKLPPGPKREALLKRARQLETASEMNAWLKSPGLQKPT
jgi:hypothetical protein